MYLSVLNYDLFFPIKLTSMFKLQILYPWTQMLRRITSFHQMHRRSFLPQLALHQRMVNYYKQLLLYLGRLEVEFLLLDLD